MPCHNLEFDRNTHPCVLNLIGSGVQHCGGGGLIIGMLDVDQIGRMLRLATEVLWCEEAVGLDNGLTKYY